MPVLPSDYKAPWFLPGAHLQTAWPALTRRPRTQGLRRTRIATPDGDFLELDWTGTGADRLAVLSHGLEGNSRRPYVLGMAAALNAAGWEVLAWNYRSCGGALNRSPRLYHSGATDDLHTVVTHAAEQSPSGPLALVGFSLGGNLSLKYLAEDPDRVPPSVTAAVALSAPVDLASCAARLSETANRPYLRAFLRSLERRIRLKHAQFPERFPLEHLPKIRTFRDFDHLYTAPVHGFRSAEHYWETCSCLPLLPRLKHPALLLNARNDPFLGPECHPDALARDHRFLHFEAPPTGGHLGFPGSKNGLLWTERRTVDFLRSVLPGPVADPPRRTV